MDFPHLDAHLESARVWTDGDTLHMTTGRMERAWTWKRCGLATTYLANLDSSHTWVQLSADAAQRDWRLPGLSDGPAQLVSLTAAPADDEGFTRPHLRMVAELHYPESGIDLRYVIWAYPDSPGIRTQLALRAADGYQPEDGLDQENAYVEALPLPRGTGYRYIGYYNDTQHRNRDDTPILREERHDAPLGRCDWASVMGIEQGTDILWWAKESHKCVNQPGLDTGAYQWDDSRALVTGCGVPLGELADGYRACWATWCVLGSGSEDEQVLALKAFDRTRYPVDPARDIYMMANTWGSAPDREGAKYAAREANVLVEIDSQADLGIDVQQIDDGWQGQGYDSWLPDPTPYPNGWDAVRHHAAERGVRPALWVAGPAISLDDLIANYDRGGFLYYKVDFIHLRDYAELEAMMLKMRAFALYAKHRIRLNWDVTENAPRVGYFLAREYGNVYLENRKQGWPPHAVYTPHLVLRDAWHIAAYLNLNKFQITVQNIDRVSTAVSDAAAHTHAYCVAITLMGTPIFFQETHHYQEAARNQIRDLLALYKAHRAGIYAGYVYPIGDEPNNATWTGFQSHQPNGGEGYVLAFRELDNGASAHQMPVRFLDGQRIRLENLLDGSTDTLTLDTPATLALTIANAPGFGLYHYRIV